MSLTASEHLLRDMTGYEQASVLVAMAELDFATVILRNGNSLGAAEVAAQCLCDKRGTEMLLDALAAMGYLAKSETSGQACYAVAEAYAPFLDSRSPSSLIPIIRHRGCQQRLWARLAWSVRDGVPQKPEPSILGEEQDRISFIMGMNSIAIGLVDGVMGSLADAGILPQNPDARILDVGGASGTYTEAFLKRLPGSTAAIFDLPVGIAQARKRFAGTDLECRVTLVEGDFTRDSLPEGFDFVWISAIIHQMDRSGSRMLYAKAMSALRPGGMLVVRDFVMSEGKTSPESGALFGVNMLVSTERGMVYTFDEIREDLAFAGFVDITHAVDVPSMAAVVTARRPF